MICKSLRAAQDLPPDPRFGAGRVWLHIMVTSAVLWNVDWVSSRSTFHNIYYCCFEILYAVLSTVSIHTGIKIQIIVQKNALGPSFV